MFFPVCLGALCETVVTDVLHQNSRSVLCCLRGQSCWVLFPFMSLQKTISEKFSMTGSMMRVGHCIPVSRGSPLCAGCICGRAQFTWVAAAPNSRDNPHRRSRHRDSVVEVNRQ